MFLLLIFFVASSVFCMDDSSLASQASWQPKRSFATSAILNVDELLKHCSARDEELFVYQLEQEMRLIAHTSSHLFSNQPVKKKNVRPNYVIKKARPPLGPLDVIAITALDPDFNPKNPEATEKRLLSILQEKLGARAPEEVDILETATMILDACYDNPTSAHQQSIQRALLQELCANDEKQPGILFAHIIEEDTKIWKKEQAEAEQRALEQSRSSLHLIASSLKEADPNFDVDAYVEKELEALIQRNLEREEEIAAFNKLSAEERFTIIQEKKAKLRGSLAPAVDPATLNLTTKEYLKQLWQEPSFYRNRKLHSPLATVPAGTISNPLDPNHTPLTYADIATAMSMAADSTINPSFDITKEELIEDFPFIPALTEAARTSYRSCLLAKFMFSLWEQFLAGTTKLHSNILQELMRSIAPSTYETPTLKVRVNDANDLFLSFAHKRVQISNANARKAIQFFQCFSKISLLWQTKSFGIQWLSHLRALRKNSYAFKVFGLMIYLQDPQSPLISWRNHSLRELRPAVYRYHAENVKYHPKSYATMPIFSKAINNDQQIVEKERLLPHPGVKSYVPPKIPLKLEQFSFYRFATFICSLTQLPNFTKAPPLGASEIFLKACKDMKHAKLDKETGYLLTGEDQPDAASIIAALVVDLEDLF